MNPVNFVDPMGLNWQWKRYNNTGWNALGHLGKGVVVKTKHQITGLLQTTIGNTVNLVIIMGSSNDINSYTQGVPTLQFSCSDNPLDFRIHAQISRVKEDPKDTLKNATVIVPMLERTDKFIESYMDIQDSSLSPEERIEAAKYCDLNTAQFAFDVWASWELGKFSTTYSYGKQYKTAFHGTSSNKASKIVGNQFYETAGFRQQITFLADDATVAKQFMIENNPLVNKTLIEFKIPKSFYDEMVKRGHIKIDVIGNELGLPAVDIGNGLEIIIYPDGIPYFNEALKNGMIKTKRFKQ